MLSLARFSVLLVTTLDFARAQHHHSSGYPKHACTQGQRQILEHAV